MEQRQFGGVEQGLPQYRYKPHMGEVDIPELSSLDKQRLEKEGFGVLPRPRPQPPQRRQEIVYEQLLPTEQSVVEQPRDCQQTIKTKNILTVVLAVLLIISLGSTIYYAIATRDSSLGTLQKILLSTGSVLVTVAAFATAIVIFWRHADSVACSTTSPKIKTV